MDGSGEHYVKRCEQGSESEKQVTCFPSYVDAR
jgi:hypothetical protein